MIYINRGLGIKCGPSDEAAVVLGTMTSGNVVTVDALGNLIDGALPVGIAVDIKGGSAGEIPFQSGSSTTTFTSGLVWNTSYGLETTIPYGEMWHHNDTVFSTLTLSSNTAGLVSVFNDASAGQALNGFTYSSNTLTTLVGGSYQVDWRISFNLNENNHKLHFYITINGANQPQTEMHSQTSAGGDIITMTAGGIIILVPTNIVNFYVLDETGASTLTVFSANVTLTRLGT